MNEFRDPPAGYRSVIFWAWNDRLDKSELARQMDLMHDAGIGGFFMHSRYGLETEYLGPEWDECVLTCVRKAAELGMEAWIYDEDRWPSGSCSGRVQERIGGLKGLTMEVSGEKDPPADDASVVSLFTARISGDRLLELRSFSGKPEEGETLLVLRLESSGASPWFNGFPPPDNLNAGSERTFIELTHEHYRKLCRGYWGTTVKGSFTDEPSLCDRHAAFDPHRGWIPWTEGLAGWMKERLGYDILPLIPYLYFEGAESDRIRHDYWRCIALKFEENYSGQIGSWCERAGISYTGHFLWEDRLGLCTRVNGYVMPHYSHENVCGIDLLGNQTEEYLTVKQCASVARQYGKDDVLTETYAGTGWDFTFEDQKRIGDWQYVLGVNRRCQHLCLYSLRGCRKRDYPPSFNYHDVWYGRMKIVEDYFARLSVILHRGEVQRSVLVIHPISTVWMHFGCSPYGNPKRSMERDLKKCDDYGNKFGELIRRLCLFHIDPDIGDETLMERTGRIVNGKFMINRCAYDTVIVPQVDTLFSSTLALLREFREKGGTVLVAEPYPAAVDGRKNDEAALFFGTCEKYSDLSGLCISAGKNRPVRITENGKECESVLCQLRKDADRYYLFITCNDTQRWHELEITTGFSGGLHVLDPLYGTDTPVPAGKLNEKGMSWTAPIGPSGSLLYCIDGNVRPEIKAESPAKRRRVLVAMDERWKCRPDTENALVLDVCRYSVDGGPLSDPMEVWRAQDLIRNELGMASVLSDEKEQRYLWIGQHTPHDGTPVRLRFVFGVEETCGRCSYLVMEDPGNFRIELDGNSISSSSSGFYLDRSFLKVKLGFLTAGEHRIDLFCRYKNRTELEACYIAGSFGVAPDRRIVPAPDVLDLGDWTEQGFPFYPGSIMYSGVFTLPPYDGRLLLDIDSFKATYVSAAINGRTYCIPWRTENMKDVTEACRVGENSMEIRVFGSLRNLLGPFHWKSGEPDICGPLSFIPDEDNYDESYKLVPYGLMESPKIWEET